MAEIDGDIAESRASANELRQSLADLERIGDRFAARMVDAFEAVAIKGKSLDGVFRSLALSLSGMALDAALKPFQSALGDLFGQAFTGFASPSGLSGLFGGTAASAPSSLGLAASAGLASPSAASVAPVHVTFNVSTPDAQSFRQSEGQLAAMLSRTVGTGQRNL
jgi:curved DNA-binding protein CbpA